MKKFEIELQVNDAAAERHVLRRSSVNAALREVLYSVRQALPKMKSNETADITIRITRRPYNKKSDDQARKEELRQKQEAAREAAAAYRKAAVEKYDDDFLASVQVKLD